MNETGNSIIIVFFKNIHPLILDFLQISFDEYRSNFVRFVRGHGLIALYDLRRAFFFFFFVDNSLTKFLQREIPLEKITSTISSSVYSVISTFFGTFFHIGSKGTELEDPCTASSIYFPLPLFHRDRTIDRRRNCW